MFAAYGGKIDGLGFVPVGGELVDEGGVEEGRAEGAGDENDGGL